MSFDTCGFIEARMGAGESWAAICNLAHFAISNDALSSGLFGLGKHPPRDPPAPFAGRGLPDDCSGATRSELEGLRAFLAVNDPIPGEEEVHLEETHAAFSEVISLARAFPEGPGVTHHSDWDVVLGIAETLAAAYGSDNVRFVLWGNW